ncbi:MAG: hypothetical protein HYX74_04935 [Acidobacteria bacterium]|nr:hypothetical protein [Acidobacteriota bacterium]
MRPRILFSLLLLLAAPPSRGQTLDFKGPYGGDVRSLALNPRSPDLLIAGTSDGQIFRTEDAGEHWKRVVGLGRGFVVDNLAFDPAVAGRVYAAVWDIQSNRGALFRSDDNAERWTSVALPRDDLSIRALAIAPSDSSTLLIGALDGVYLSRDAGKSWELISQGEKDLINIESLAVDPRSADVFYAGTWHLGAKTTDGGKTWVWIKRGMSDDSDLFNISMHPAAPDVVYASACSGVYKSTNGGSLWVRLRNGLPSEARRTRSFHIDPTNPDRLFAGTTQGLFLSENAGASWKRITSPDLTINAVAVNPRNPSQMYLGTDDAGILKSDDGGRRFLQSNFGFAHRQVAQLVSDPREQRRLYVSVLFDRTYGGLFISGDGGTTWRQSNRGIPVAETEIYTILPASTGGNMYLGTSGGIYLSRDRGENWTKLAIAAKSEAASRLLQSEIFQLQFLSVQEQQIGAATSNGLYVGDLITGKWTRVLLPRYNGKVSALIADLAENSLFAATDLGVFTSRDGGKSWMLRGDGLPIVPIRVLERLPGHQVMLAGTSYGLYRSADDGETWHKVRSGIPPVDISVLRKGSDGRSVYAGDFLRGNVYASYNLGINWHALTQGMNSGVSSLIVDPLDDSILFLGSRSDGIYSLRLPMSASVSFGESK